jgi:FKBP-type peptidyl-prolyl cis-trans isomerase FkpA
MKQFINAAVICAVALTACTTPFKKAKDGTNYKVISDGKGAKLTTGNYMELESVVKYKDSVLYNSYDDGMPQYPMYDTASFPEPFKQIFTNIRVGDSIVVRISTDSIIKKGQSAPFMQKGQYLYQMFKINGVYTSKEQSDSAQKTHIPAAQAKMFQKALKQVDKILTDNKAQVEADTKVIDAYLAKNNIKATKTKWGTYVAITTEGTGNTITSKDVATVNYTGKSLDSGKVFDSNIDPAFKHVQPYDVQINSLGSQNSVIPGWIDALMQMKKGTKATVYIPSTLGYGKQGNPPAIMPDAVLIFDMEVVNVINEAEAMAKREAEEKQMRAMQQKMMDSMRKANPKIDAELKSKGQ